ncbi:heavy metal translocating P-type ATPase [Halorubrum lacusprofundi]|jgi:Cu2+-exporting ATPase|uniref:Heavy metal translocating P-type ATPase n=1 Tax=Halorubrum lacusprofundi (strain ATCC 49239 / DSM 5036 / JCM 8891 / ACAM 34) TaxID=416348 RepID=B9LSN7_HALLT|nr:heavy metal translocating P-type ATPase [Halorubrum lacusprofundi]ACM57984.1 heavy metal translocating P-type ATPase [Halorubrum lacusprofundi ATCC 49239]
MPPCTLCDLPTGDDPHTAPDVDGEFCCRGCLAVARSLGDAEGLDGLDEVEERRPDAEPDDDFEGETTFLHVDGMHCATCESFLEMTAGEQAGVAAAEASYATDTIRVDYDPDAVGADELPERLSVAGYSASNRADPDAEGDDAVVRFLIGGGFFGMMAMLWYVVFLYPTYFGYEPFLDLGGVSGLYLFTQVWVFASIVLFYTGYPILRGAYVSLRARQPNMDLLVSIAAVSSYAYSTLAMFLGRTDLYFDVTIAVILVVTAGNHYESLIKRRATGALSELTTVTDREVRTEAGETVATDAVAPGDRLLVRPSERVPFDGIVAEGAAAVDEALVTGESLPATKREGDAVRGGTVVTDAPIVVEVGEDAESTLDTLVRMLWEIQSSRSGIQRLVDKLATVFVPLVVAVAVLAAGATLAFGASPTEAALVGLTVLIVSCPCALGLATPLAVAAGIRDAARRGIVIVSDAVFEEAADIDTVVLDKTGTLTDGQMRLLGAETDGTDPATVRKRAAALERASVHPIAEAIVAGVRGEETEGDGIAARPAAATDGGTAIDGSAARDDGTGAATEPSPAAADVTVTDRGVSGRIDGDEVVVGHRSLFEGDAWAVSESLDAVGADAREAGRVPVYVGWDGAVRGVLVVGDEVREGWEAVVEDLAADGRRVVVLTGDSPAAARRFEEHPAIDETFAEVPPEAKAETVRRLTATERVAMVGDGSNDAPALAAADIGISVASGTDLAADAADAVLLEDRLSAIPELFAVTRGTNRRLKQNLGWAFVYNAVAIPMAVSGVLNPLFAAVAMGTSSLLVVSNSARAVYKGE